ncbi:MAG: DUF1127 domain-containing protein [Silicimonas sp.]|nr:DUF1127 domain-containing protein [Silicimonas sp.]
MTMMTNDIYTNTIHRGKTARRTGMLARFSAWYSLISQRRTLSKLDDHLLDDIGISREAARKEARRPVWDAPNQWLR